jgi:hypothetical protein
MRLLVVAIAASFALGLDCHGYIESKELSQSLLGPVHTLDVSGFGAVRKLVELQLPFDAPSKPGRLGVRRAPLAFAGDTAFAGVAPDWSGSKPFRDRRLAILGRKSESLTARVGREFHGPFDVRVTAARGSTAGFSASPGAQLQVLRPWVPLNPVQLSPPAPEQLAGYTLNAVWNGADEGWTVSATFGTEFGSGSGLVAVIPDTRQIDLRLVHTGSQARALVRPTPRVSEGGVPQPWTLLFAVNEPHVDTPQRLLLGGTGLEKGTVLLYDFLRLESDGPCCGQAPSVEETLLASLEPVIDDLVTAALASAGGALDAPAASVALQSAIDGLDAAAQSLEDAMDAETLAQTTRGKQALRLLTRALSKSDKSLASAALGAKAAAVPIHKQILSSLDRVLVATGNLHGVRAGSLRQLPIGPTPLD